MMTEIVPLYSEEEREKLEDRRELLYSRRHNLEIFQYWLRKTNTILMVLVEEGFDDREFQIPNAEVLEAQDHPELYAHKASKGRKITRPYEVNHGA